jgi:hypothetical protein
MAGPPNLADHANFNRKLEGRLNSAKVSGRIYINIYISTTNTPQWSPVGFDPRTSVDAQALTTSPITNAPQVPLGISAHGYYLKGVIRPELGREAWTVRTHGHGFRCKGLSSLQVAEGT